MFIIFVYSTVKQFQLLFFSGGAAEKCGKLQAGDELLGVNDTNINKMTRIEVWSMMKKLTEGEVILKIRKID